MIKTYADDITVINRKNRSFELVAGEKIYKCSYLTVYTNGLPHKFGTIRIKTDTGIYLYAYTINDAKIALGVYLASKPKERKKKYTIPKRPPKIFEEGLADRITELFHQQEK